MGGLIDQLRARLEELTKEFERARTKAQEAMAVADRLGQDVAAYSQTLAAEERRLGKTVTPAKPTTAQQPTLMPSMKIQRGKGDKTSVAFGAITQGGAQGVTVDDIEAALKAHGFDAKRNYIFNITSRLKQGGTIEQRGKRYYVKQ